MKTALSRLKDIFHRTFDIREGEFRNVLLMQLHIFLVITTLLIIKSTVNSLFISRFGAETLPFGYIVVAIFAVTASVFYSRIQTRYRINHIFYGIYYSSVLMLLAFGIFLRLNITADWVLWVFYVWVAMFGLLCATQFWLLANLIFTVRQAKRLFGFIGAGAIAGGIVGGYVTSIFAQVLGTESLPFLAAFFMALCIPLFRIVWQGNPGARAETVRAASNKSESEKSVFNLIRRSKHLTLLAWIIGISVLVAKLVDFQYSALASELYKDPDQLTSFFGFWFSTMNIVSLVIQLFVTRHLVVRLGVVRSLMFLPVGILAGSMFALLWPELWAVLLMKVSDGSLKQSVNKAAVELLVLPVPTQIKNRAKPFIDVIVDSIATGITGILLIGVLQGLNLGPRVVTVMIALLVMLWIYFALRVRREYLNSFRERLKGGADLSMDESDWRKGRMLKHLDQILSNGSEAQILFVLNQFQEMYPPGLEDRYVALLRHPAAKIRRAALLNLYEISGAYGEIANRLLQDPDHQVRIYAAEYLLRHERENRFEMIATYMLAPELEVRCATLVAISRESRGNAKFQIQYGLEKEITKLRADMTDFSKPHRILAHTHILYAIGRGQLPALYDEIESALYHPEPDVQEAALLAAGYSQDSRFLRVLLERLGQPRIEGMVEESLKNLGSRLPFAMMEVLAEKQMSIAFVRALPHVLGAVEDQHAVEMMFDLLDHPDKDVRYEALQGLNLAHQRFPALQFDRKDVMRHLNEELNRHHRMLPVLHVQRMKLLEKGDRPESNLREMLVRSLEESMDQGLEMIFRLLGLRYDPNDVFPIYLGLRQREVETQRDALDFLESLLGPQLRQKVMPVVEASLLDIGTAVLVRKLKVKLPDERKSLQMLMEDAHPRISAAAAELLDET